MRRSLLAVALAGAAAVHAQPQPPVPSDVPPPPPLRLEGLIPLAVAGAGDMRWGVDPQSVQVGADGIVRYVVVARSPSGAVNAFYESLRCTTTEVLVHARRGGDGDWVRTPPREDWRVMSAGSAATRHSLAVARAGACAGTVPTGQATDVLRELRRSAAGPYTDQSR